jgi:hypothetical protein
VAVFGASRRAGRWTPARRVRATALFGGAEVDLREARLPPGVTELRVFACRGAVEVIVPPTLAIETEGTGIFGAFEEVDRASGFPDPEAPLLRITGTALFGAVEVRTRFPQVPGMAEKTDG